MPGNWKRKEATSWVVMFWSILGFVIVTIYNMELRSFIIGQEFVNAPTNIYELSNDFDAAIFHLSFVPQGDALIYFSLRTCIIFTSEPYYHIKRLRSMYHHSREFNCFMKENQTEWQWGRVMPTFYFELQGSYFSVLKMVLCYRPYILYSQRTNGIITRRYSNCS